MATFKTASFNRSHGASMGVADKDYFLDENGEVTDDESKSAFLLIRKGQDVPADMAEKYGDALSGKVAQGAKAAKPASNKAEKPADNKGVK